MIGREREVEQVLSYLRQPNATLVTLIGPGGVGKTSLAEHIAASLDEELADGSVFVDLSVVNDALRVPSAIAQALKLKAIGGASIVERLRAYLSDKELLLLLDNFETVLDAASPVSDLVRASPRVKVLATSRAPLHLRDEQKFQVQPLASPSLAQSILDNALLDFPAGALFVQRARLVKPEFSSDPSSLAIIAEICRRLDGLPLAIELAAARMMHLTLPMLRDRLDHRLQILTGGARDLPRATADDVRHHRVELRSAQAAGTASLSPVFRVRWNVESERRAGRVWLSSVTRQRSR